MSLSAAEGQGEGSVPFNVASNADPSTRSTSITVNDQRLEIAQQGKPCEFSLSTDRETVEGSGGDRTVQVRTSSAQCAWTAAADVSWITIVSGREGRGDGAVSFHVDAVEGPPRTGTLNIGGQRLQVEQGTGCALSIDRDAFSVGASGGDRQVTVTVAPGCPWTAESNTSWITITDGRAGSGSGRAGFRVSPTNGPTRTGTLRVAGRTVTVVQSDGCSISASPTNQNAPASGGSATIQIEAAAGCTWTAATEVAWLTITGPATGTGKGQVQVAVAANAGPARSGSIVIGGQPTTIAQASGCTYAISSDRQQIPASGGPAVTSVSTTAGCPWSVTGAVPWITVTTPSGSGPAQLTFAVAANQGPPREGTLTIAGQTYTVNQASACTWSFNPPSHELGTSGGVGTVLVFVTGACTWTAESTVDWIRITTGTPGVGQGLVQFLVSPNAGPARTGVILIGGEKYQVRQHGG